MKCHKFLFYLFWGLQVVSGKSWDLMKTEQSWRIEKMKTLHYHWDFHASVAEFSSDGYGPYGSSQKDATQLRHSVMRLAMKAIHRAGFNP